METERCTSEEQDYDEIDFYLQKAQEEIGEALSCLSPGQGGLSADAEPISTTAIKQRPCYISMDTIPERFSSADGCLMDRKYNSLPHPRKKGAKILDYNRQFSDASGNKNCHSVSVDFHSIFAQSDPLGDDYLTNLEVEYAVGRKEKPERPQTLTPPARLPKCCNFRNRDWRFYVSGNFNTDIRDDRAVNCIDPLDHLMNEEVVGCALGTNKQVPASSVRYCSSELNDSSQPNMDEKDVDEANSKRGNAASSHSTLSSTTGSFKAPGNNYRNYSTDVGLHGRHGDDKKENENQNNDDHCFSNGVIDSDVHVNHRSDRNESRHLCTSLDRGTARTKSRCVRNVDGVSNAEVRSYNEVNKVSVNGYVNDDETDEATLDYRTAAVGIKTNGCLVMSTKRTMRERRMRARSDPSKMATHQVCLGHDHWPSKPGHQVAAVQTEGPLDGILSPTVDRRRMPTTPLMDAMDLSGHWQTRTARLGDDTSASAGAPPGGQDKSETTLAADCRKRSQSADRLQPRRQRCSRPRDNSRSPNRRGGSPAKSESGAKGVSKVSRSTQTHRSIIRYGSSASPAVVKNVANKSNNIKSATIHIQLDEVLAAQSHGGPTIESQKQRDDLSSNVNKTGLFQENQKGKTKAKMAVVSSSPSISQQNNPCYVCQECEQKGLTNGHGEVGHKKCSCPTAKVKPILPTKLMSSSSSSSSLSLLTSNVSSTTSTSGKSSLPALVPELTSIKSGSSGSPCPKITSSPTSRIKSKESENCALCAEGASHAGKTLVFVPSRESRRIYIRPQMPVIVEDVPKAEEEIGDDLDTGSTALCKNDVQYYGSLKIRRSPQPSHRINTLLSKSASEVYKQLKSDSDEMPAPKSGAKTLLDSMHRKYCANQYRQHEKARSDETLTVKDDADFNVSAATKHITVVQHSKSTTHLSDSKLRLAVSTVTPDAEGHRSPGYGSLTSSPPGSSSGSATSPKSPGCKSEGVSRSSSGIGSLSSNQSQKSSPSPEEHQGDPDYDEAILIDCCDSVTPECDMKSFQMMLKSDKEYAEIEAIEACKWLRAAGFPQYAQMYEDHQFPVEISAVERDHDFLDNDSLQSLFRRLNTLNKCATMKIEAAPSKSADDSDDEDTCALSDKWKYQRSSRRWSRKDLESILPTDGTDSSPIARSGIRSCSSHDSVITDNDESLTSQQEDSPTLHSRTNHKSTSEHFVLGLPPESGQSSPGSHHNTSLTSGHVSDSDHSNTGSFEPPMSPSAFKRSASEKFRNARHTFFRRMESLKSRKGSIKNKSKPIMGKIDIGAPVLVETRSIQEKMDKLGCKEISPSAETSPNLSMSSRNTDGSGVQDTRGDNDSVFLELEDASISTEMQGSRTQSDGNLKSRNLSESAVTELIVDSCGDKDNATAVLSNGIVESGNGSHGIRTGSFSFSKCHGDQHAVTVGNGLSAMSTSLPNGLPESNNNEKNIKLRQRDGSIMDNRLSVYDNVPEDESDAVKELDMIVQSLMRDISDLNATWGMTQSGNATPFPIDITLEEAIMDFDFGDKDSTLTRKSKSDTLKLSNNIPLLPVDSSNCVTSSSSSSSSTIAHSTGLTPSSLPSTSIDHPEQSASHLSNCLGTLQHNDDDDVHHAGGQLLFGDVSSCSVQSTHIHVDSPDEMLDSILQSLENHYGASKQQVVDGMASESRMSDQSTHNGTDVVIVNGHDGDVEVDSHSGSVSNAELSDVETTPGSREEDGSETCDGRDTRERRDSGVGSSLTREPSDRRRYRIRWHSFAKSHRPSFNSRDLQINSMSAGQLKLLRKFSLLKITALMEKYSMNRSGWNWVMPMNKFMRRFKVNADYKDKNVFGVPLQVILQRTGQALPQCMLHAMRSLRKNAHDAVGIFRKSGVRSRIQKLRDDIEADPESMSFDSLQAYDVADVLKQYFRELPECLLTNKLSETFISIFTHVPQEQRLEAVYAAVMLLPDENREVLQSLLLFLSDMADYAKYNQMNASNLAVCFAPSLFHICGSRVPPGASPKRHRKKEGIPDQRELQEQKAAHECLTEMIINCKKIFMVPADILRMCHFSYMDQCVPVPLEELGHHSGDETSEGSGYLGYLDSCIQGLLKESRDKFKGWVSISCPSTIDLAYKKIDDGYSLRLWKCSTEVEAPPCEVLTRVCSERQLWDEDLLKWRVVETLDKNTEVFQYVLNNMAPHPTRDFCELRHWRTDLPKGACVLVSTSVEHHNGPLLGGVRAVVLASRYLIEPCGSGKSRLTHISRVDLRGHTPEWYNKVYGHLCVNYMNRIKDSFCQKAEGPETNV